MVDKYDYLLKQGWSQADAEKYIELQERGMSPSQAFQSVKGGAASEKQIPVEHVYEQEPQTEKAQFESSSMSEKLFGRKITAEEVEAAAGRGIAKAHQITKEELKSLAEHFKPKPLSKEDIEVQEAFRKGRHTARVSRAKIEGYRSGYGGYSVARPPTRTKIVMKPPRHVDLPGGNMGMEISVLIDPLGLNQFSGVRQPVKEYPSRDIGRQVQTRVSAPKTEFRTGKPRTGYTPLNNPNAYDILISGTVGSRALSTKIPKTEKPVTKFKGRKPKTKTQKPKIETKIITKRMFWVL